MKKIITKETREKMNKALQESIPKKILQIQGFSIFVDDMNYTVREGKNTLYFSTFDKALIEIRDQLVRSKLVDSKTLDEAINRINSSDQDFIGALSSCLYRLDCTKIGKADTSTVSKK